MPYNKSLTTKNGNIFVRHCLFFVEKGKKSCDNNSLQTNNSIFLCHVAIIVDK